MSLLFKKKFLLCTLLCFFNIYSMDPVDTTESTIHTIDISNNTDTYHSNTDLNDLINDLKESFDVVIVEKDIETGNICIDAFNYPESYNDTNNTSHNPSDDYREAEQDSKYSTWQENAAHEHEVQKENKYSSWSEAVSTSSTTNKSLSYEKKTFNKPYTDPIKTLEKNLQSPEYRKRLEDHKDSLQKTLEKQWTGKQKLQDQIDTINSILDGSMVKMLTNIKNGSFKDVREAFGILKNMYPWKPKNSYLIDKPTAEQQAFNDIVGIDIMKTAESALVGRADYLRLNGASPESVEYCIKNILRPMQLQGDKKGLEQFRAQRVAALKENDSLQRKAEIVAVDSLLSDPLTQILDNIKNAGLNIAERELGTFKMQILHHIETQNLKNMDEVKADMIEREGADILEAANKCFESRPDYPSYQARIAQQSANTAQNTNNTNSNNQDTKANANQDIPDGIDLTFEEKTTTASSTQNDTANAPKKQNTNDNHDWYGANPSHKPLQKKENPNNSQTRRNARNLAHTANPTARREQTYVLNPDVWARLHTYHINPEQFTSCVGNEVQQQIHSECVSIFNETTHIPSNTSTQPLIDMTIACAFAGNVSSQQNNTEQAFSLTDCAWAALNCAKALCEKGIDIAKTGTVEIAKGVAHGLKNAVQNNVNMVMDPVGTVTNMAHAFGNLAYCVYKLTEPLMIYDEEMGANEETITRVNEEWLENMHSVIDAAKGVTLQGATAFVTESLVSPKITKMGFGLLSHYAQKPIAQLVKVAKEAKDKVVDQTQKIVKAARQVVDKIDKPAPQYIYVKTNTGKVIKLPMPVEIEETADTLYNTMGKQNANSHNKKPTFNDIKKEVSKDAKVQETIARKTMMKGGPNGIYEDAPYHHKNSNGIKNPAPTDGQHALNNSLKIEGKNSSSRIALSNDEFVVLMEDSPNKFHGHVRNWNDLDELTQNTLIKSGLVTHRGKIIK